MYHRIGSDAHTVGLPNVGKSSFFNALCSMQVPAENFPVCLHFGDETLNMCNADHYINVNVVTNY